MNILALAATALLATAPATDGPTIEYTPPDQVPNWYTTVPYMQTGVCMLTERDITCATNTQWKHATFHDRYTRTLYKFIRKEQQC